VKSIASALAGIARRAPSAVIIVSLALTGIFGYLAGQVEVATGNEGFAPDSPEIGAGERISELFGDATADTALQVVLRDQGGDVITAEGCVPQSPPPRRSGRPRWAIWSPTGPIGPGCSTI